MAVDYTVIQEVRQRFGDSPQDSDFEIPVEMEAPFVGYAKEFPFSCPNVDSSQPAVLHLESLGLSAYYGSKEFPRNTLMINAKDVPGGLTPGAMGRTYKVAGTPEDKVVVPDDFIPYWKAHSLLVPADFLDEQNTLYVEAVKWGSSGVDHFIIDNVVIFFKTRATGPVIGDVGPGG
jgi:hypothetical protein